MNVIKCFYCDKDTMIIAILQKWKLQTKILTKITISRRRIRGIFVVIFVKRIIT